MESYALNDAVVIRTGDLFAGPALHAYAHTIALVASQTCRPGTPSTSSNGSPTISLTVLVSLTSKRMKTQPSSD